MQRQGRLDEAAALHRQAFERYRDELGPAHQSTAITVTNLAYNAFLRDRLAEAESLYREALPVLDSVWGKTARIGQTLMDFGAVLKQRGKCDEAETHLRRSLTLAMREGPRSPIPRLPRGQYSGDVYPDWAGFRKRSHCWSQRIRS